MAENTIDVTPYDGSLLAAQLLSGSKTLVLSDFDASQSMVLSDDDGTLGVSDSGVATLDGVPLTYIGSGTAQAGVDVAGLTVGIGALSDVVVFEAGGQIYFHYPDGEPSEIGMVALVVTLTNDPYEVIPPVCFTRGTMIATPDGETAVENLRPGDRIRDAGGAVHVVHWVPHRRIVLGYGLAERIKLVPVHIPADSFGPGRPHRALRLSQQHNICVDHVSVALYFGLSRALIPARALINGRITLDRRSGRIDYYHVVCDTHVVLLANGLPCESLRVTEEGLAPVLERQRVRNAPPDTVTARFHAPMRAAAPRLTVFEGRIVRAAIQADAASLDPARGPEPEHDQRGREDRVPAGHRQAQKRPGHLVAHDDADRPVEGEQV